MSCRFERRSKSERGLDNPLSCLTSRDIPAHSRKRATSHATKRRVIPCLVTRIVDLMDAEVNKQLVMRFYEEVWAGGNIGFAAEVFADD